MPAITVPRRYDALNKIILAQEIGQLQPAQIIPAILYTMDWFPQSMYYEQDFNFETDAGAPGSTTVGSTTVPAGFFWFVPVASVDHAGVGNKTCELLLQHPATGNIASIHSGNVARKPNETEAITRPVIVPAAHRFLGACRDILAGEVLTIRFFYLQLRWGETIPRH